MASPSFQAAVGAALREKRLAVGLSQAGLAQLVGVTQASLSNYENGKRDMPLLTVFCMAGALGEDPASFIGALVKDVR